ncbi:MAG: biopolymer transporter ExbD [Selenomonadaceae bacterium]|nr:biopolymer transporter ExbD [Selenomonadaceae bacterium]
MNRRDFREKNQPLVMIIPMIDIMLFLLIFFMISTIYMVQVNTLQVALPQAANGKQDTRQNIISITITANGEIFYDKETEATQNLPLKIQDSLKNDSETVFVIRGDRSTRYENVVAILDLLKKSGCRHVSIATEIKAVKGNE